MTENWDVYQQRELLLLDTRRKILEVIYRKPGIHFRELARKTGLATGQLEYHTYRMKRAGLIRSEKDGKYTRFYPPIDYGETVERIIRVLNRPRTKEILEYMVEKECATTEDIAKLLELSPSAIIWHLKRLEKDGIVATGNKNNKKCYTLKNKDATIRALQIHREGLLDELAKKLAEMWLW